MRHLTLLALLAEARTLIGRAGAWLHDAGIDGDAVDAAGIPCDPWDVRAERRDLHGALTAVAHASPDAHGMVRRACLALQHANPERIPLADPPRIFAAITDWHDDPARTHGEVLRALDRAIVRAREADDLGDRRGRLTEGAHG